MDPSCCSGVKKIRVSVPSFKEFRRTPILELGLNLAGNFQEFELNLGVWGSVRKMNFAPDTFDGVRTAKFLGIPHSHNMIFNIENPEPKTLNPKTRIIHAQHHFLPFVKFSLFMRRVRKDMKVYHLPQWITIYLVCDFHPFASCFLYVTRYKALG